MRKIIITGCLAALFFSSTFVLNRAMSLEGGHWVWTSSLRYLWMLLLLSGWMLVSGKARLLGQTLSLFKRHWIFWTTAGSIGFGLFYALITYSVTFAPGWIVATTWQTTILATPLVLLGFGRKVSLRALALTLIVFAGVILVNVEHAASTPLSFVLLGALPVLGAGFAYPVGNQMVWEAREGGNRFIPAIDHPAMSDGFARVLLLTLGSVPLWLALILATTPPAPSEGQLIMTGTVALLSGVIATTLFLNARYAATNASELAAADCTQSMEVVFALAGECLFLDGALPGMLGAFGIALTVIGLVLYIRVQNVR
ncbi:DMT family transporter [Salidesulfovibrio onnuriiensis]|uniref:DMT family transporter n=1 Tax=Salidesulfovibrio onnuriiensis TaxID=2583823 RepID=UPI0011CB6CBF|nr:multidrug resistance efflux transporter family protein [Salidesulfovibrio onnuriiensis]